MEKREERIRNRAYRLWEQEGRPDGRAEAHWEAAAELVAIEENETAPAAPNSRSESSPDRAGARPVKRERA
jgi:hypothetical protein